MGVYLGESGWVEVRRTAVDSEIFAIVNPPDVDIANNRIGFDRSWGSLLTGDQVYLRSADGAPLTFIAGRSFNSIECFLNVDELAGIRLYSSFKEAVNDYRPALIPLAAISADQSIIISVNNVIPNVVGKIQSYELSTTRETVDITALGEQFRMQYSAGLISGQGSLTCFWDYQSYLCNATGNGMDENEWAHYFHNLVIRTDIGASFYGRFILKDAGDVPPGASAADSGDKLFYRALCIVTNVSITFGVGQAVMSVIDFITSGPIYLRLAPDQPVAALLLEGSSGGRVLLESAGSLGIT